jgi:hypothetical protein
MGDMYLGEGEFFILGEGVRTGWAREIGLVDWNERRREEERGGERRKERREEKGEKGGEGGRRERRGSLTLF